MAFVPVKQVGQFGVNRDLATPELARNWAKNVIFRFCFAIRLVSIFRAIKHSQVNALPIHGNGCPPPLLQFVPIHTQISAGIVGLLSFVLMVLGVSTQTKICKSVVSRISVDMVNVLIRKFSMNISPRKSMCLIFLVKNLNLNSARTHQLVVPASYQRFYSVDFPSKESGFWFVMKNLADTLNVNAIFHAQFPLIEKLRVMVLGNWHGNQLSGATLAKQGAF